MRVFLFVPVALLALAAAACGGSDTQGSVPSNAVAVVGDDVITKAEFEHVMTQGRRGYESQGRKWPKPGTQDYNNVRDLAVRTLVQQSEFQQKADDMGLEVTDADIEKRLKEIKKQYFDGNEQKYRKAIKAQGFTEADVRDTVKNQLISQKIYNEVTGEVKVSDADAKKYYDENRGTQYQTAETRDVRHILIACQDKNCPKAKEQADKIFSELQNGGDFAALAKKYSDDPGSKAQGGKLTVEKGKTVATFDQTAFLLGKGKISRPLKTQYGYHIIQPLSSIKPAKVTPFAQVKQSIKQQLLQQKKNEAMTKWLEDARKDFNVRYQVGYAPPKDQPAQTQQSQ